MSEIVKVDGAWHLTPQLAKDMGMSLFQLKQHFAREYVIPYLAKQIDDRKLKGKDRSGQGGARLGFGDIFINGQKKNIQNVTAYFDKRKDNITFTDVGKNKEVSQDRAEGQYGFNPDTVKQVEFLDDVEKLKTELKERTDFPKGPDDARNAEKDFHNKMRKLFRKNYRGRIQYDPNVGTNYGWPEGKSQQGFMKWQRYIYKALGEGVDGDEWHRGHGLPVNKKGTNSLSNLALEPAKANLQTQDKEGTYREPEELDRVYVAHGKSEALQEYLAFADDDKIMTPMDLLPEDHAALLQNVDEDPEAIFAQGLRKKENQALSTYNNGGAIKVRDLDSSQLTGRAKHEAMVKETKAASIRDSQFKDQSQENLEGLQNLAEDFWGASMDSAGLGAVKNTIYAGKAVLDKDPVGIVTNAAAVIPELKIVTDEPLIKTKLTHKVNQLPMAM